MAGYRWELSGEQRMDIPGESENGLTAFSGSVDYQEIHPLCRGFRSEN